MSLVDSEACSLCSGETRNEQRTTHVDVLSRPVEDAGSIPAASTVGGISHLVDSPQGQPCRPH